ncbi:MAG: hypothetical protein LUD81_03065 [Clostridiales bacterium]|nr:hypothetical protein [Clostridiales bacterium]
MKKTLSGIFTIFFAAVFSLSALAAEQTTLVMTVDSNIMTVNGEKQQLEQAPVIIDGRTLVPVRAAVEAIGGEADWNSDTREITITKGTDVISMTIDSTTAYLNGEEAILDTAPVIINSRTCMPIRFIAESLDFDVSWNADERQITITGTAETEEEISEDISDNEETETTEDSEEEAAEPITEVYVSFGDSEFFTLHLYDNETAATIGAFAAMEDWQLPIYHYDDYENWEVMQYYEIPSSYEIPTNPETVMIEAAGSVYMSEDSEILLFYKDAEVEGEYTPIGYFDWSEEFVDAIENNPVVEGWDNKLIHISIKN